MSTIPTTQKLQAIFGDDMLQPNDAGFRTYASDMCGSTHYHQAPAAVVFPTRTRQIQELMRLANRHTIPITARGGGSGLSGGAIAASGGIICSMERMNTITEIDTDNLAAVLQPGVLTRDLDKHLQESGLFFAGYPMSEEICTIGGNVATNAGGGRAVKYGVTSNHVLGLKVVLTSGAVLSLGGKIVKNTTGTNVMSLFIGSEGTLGIITEITLRLTPRPNTQLAMLAGFTSHTQAVACVTMLRANEDCTPSSIEYMDGNTARQTAAELWKKPVVLLPQDSKALLLIEVDGSSTKAVTEKAKQCEAVVEAAQGTLSARIHDGLTTKLWKLRKAVPWWVKRRSGEYHSVEDVVVPCAAVDSLITNTLQLPSTSTVDLAIFGHAGDGNFHINPMKPPSMPPEQWQDALHRFLTELYDLAISLGGTISGEHGIGRKRVRYLHQALPPAVIDTMRQIKTSLDPKNILNPGVMLPEAEPTANFSDSPQDSKRVVILHGFEYAAIDKIMNTLKAELPDPRDIIFAKTTKNSLTMQLAALIEDISADHQYLKENPPLKNTDKHGEKSAAQ